MALFDSDKSDKEETHDGRIRPTVVRTKNVAQELIKIAKSNRVKVDSLDFNILEVQTFTRENPEGQGEAEWEEKDPETLKELSIEKDWLNPQFEIEQMYEVEIFSKFKDDPYKDFNVALAANGTKCKIFLSIKKGSMVEYLPTFERDLLHIANKSKVKVGVLINILDDMLKGVVSKIAAHVRVQEKVTYEKNENYLICEAFEPTPAKDDNIIFHYKEKEELTDVQKVDYAKRGFIEGVVKDEVLIEYKKPKDGLPGRNCLGKFLQPREPKVEHEPNFSVSAEIDVKDSEDKTEYIAKENGYVAFEENQYRIKKELDIAEVSFKSTGDIDSGVDSEVNLVVKEADAVKDAVGTGMRVEVSEIDIEGNVGSGSFVHALKAKVGGQTHKTSEIRADDLDINIHKGIGYGKDVHITRLEHGTIYGKTVDIKQAIGGVVNAEEANIDICASYVKVTASKKIEIHNLHGEENIFTIDPLVKSDSKKGIEENEKKITELKEAIRDLDKEIQKYTAMVKSNEKAYNDLKRKLTHYKKSGIKLPSAFVTKFKGFVKVKEHLEHVLKEKESKVKELELYDRKSSLYQEGITEARIINHHRWKGHNEIRFKLVDPPIELVHKPQEGSTDMIFGIEKDEDGEYYIKAMKE